MPASERSFATEDRESSRDRVVPVRATLFEQLESSGIGRREFPPKVLRWLERPASSGGRRIGLCDSAARLELPDLRHARVVLPDSDAIPTTEWMDDTHGTWSLSLLCAQGESRVSGLVPDLEVYLAPVLSPGVTPWSAVASAVRWFVSQGCDLILLPLGGAGRDPTLDTLIRDATGGGALILAAAGNCWPSPILYPARLGDVVAVAATDRHGHPLPECCREPEPDLWFPADAIPGLGACGELEHRRGSSVACVLAGAFFASLRRPVTPGSPDPELFVSPTRRAGAPSRTIRRKFLRRNPDGQLPQRRTRGGESS